MVLHSEVHTNSFCDPRRLPQLCLDLLKKRLPTTSQRTTITTNLCAAYHRAHRASTQPCPQVEGLCECIRLISTGTKCDKQPMLPSVTHHRCYVFSLY